VPTRHVPPAPLTRSPSACASRGRWRAAGTVISGDRTIYDVFARSGEFRHTVVLPRAIHAEPTPFLSASAVVGATTDPLTDESIILRFEAEPVP